MDRHLMLPSGAHIRGRRLAEVPGAPADFLLALGRGALPGSAEGPVMPAAACRRIDWPDFWIPADRADAIDALREVLRRARAGQLVDVACRGGRGRTGTALAAIAVLDGLAPTAAIAWVRREYHPKAVETPWQAWWVHTVGRPS